nr:nucleotide-binding alpha-beta plait domain-containing protein [Tanacetum cinerariifolium]
MAPISHSYREALACLKHQVPSNKNVVIEEDMHLRFRLERCWTGHAKNFQMIQNAWSVVENNGLADCKAKYYGGLTFLFEWPSKKVALKSLDENKLWLQQWFEGIKPWEDDRVSVGRLAWLSVEGLPLIARNVGAIKSIMKLFGRVLEIGKLNFDSNILLPIKSLVFVPNMNDIDSEFEEEAIGPSTANSSDGGKNNSDENSHTSWDKE